MAKKNTDGLRKGNPGNKGGGRPPNWVREKADEIVDRLKLLDFLGRVADGREKEEKVTKDGDVVEVAAAISDRVWAATYLIDRAAGKAPQAIVGKGGGNVIVEVLNYANAD